jgi:sugar lactone lactonase YvrE
VIDAADNIYVLDGGIRKMTPAGVVTTITAEISGSGLAIDQASNFYVINIGIISKISPTGSITTLPNRVPGGNSIAVDSNGYLIATGEAAIFKVDQAGGVSAFAGSTTCCTRGSVDGIGTAAQFDSITMRAVTDKAGNLLIADTFNNAIRKLTPQGVVTAVVGAASVRGGADGVGTEAQFRQITGIAAASGGDIFLTDSGNFTIRKVTSSGITSTFAGSYLQQGTADGIGAAARFFNPIGIAADTSNNLWVTDISSNPVDVNYLHSAVRRVTPTGAVSTVAGAPGADANPVNLGSSDGTGAAATFRNPIGIAADSSGNKYIADSANHTIRKITPDGLVSTFAGNPGNAGSTDGIGGSARFQNPVGITTDSSGNVFVVDVENRQTPENYFSPIIPAGIAKPVNTVIRKMTPDGVVTTLAGAPGTAGSVDGMGSTARFNNAHGITADGSGNLYVADTGNHTVRKITPAGSVTTIAGVANNAGIRLGSAPGYLSAPSGVAMIAPNMLAIISDNCVLRLTLP